MDFSRKECKKNAKGVLKKQYFMALIMSLILCFAGATAYQSNSSGSGDGGADTTPAREYSLNIPTDQYGLPAASFTVNDFLSSSGITNPVVNQLVGNMSFITFSVVFVGILLTVIVLSLLLRFFLGYQLEIGARGWFFETAQGRESDFGSLARGFRDGAFLRVFGAMFMRDLLTFLWTLALIIPGIIKNYEYLFVPYILAENPHIGSARSREISKGMTNGYKMELFIMDISFIGWRILGTLLFGVGQVLVWPYVDASFAQAYLQLRGNAINNGVVSEDELGAVEVVDRLQ